MTQGWRPISPDEAATIETIVSASGIRGGDKLIRGLSGAVVSNSALWILDVRVSTDGGGTDLPDGPFPSRAYVPNGAAYRGEIIIWLNAGRVSGLEYAWITDDPPNRWPHPDEMEVVAQEGF
jgi:hypothetical protein